jgi:hypothetical protein
MKKNILLSALIVLVIISCTIFISDGPAYLVVSLMALTIMAAIYRNRTRVIKMTRWSKANPGKAQLLITGLQIVLMALGIIAGNNLKELGYEFSNTTTFVFTAILVIGFFCVPFLPQRKTIVLPKQVNRQRFAFMSIALSSFVLMVVLGNRLQDKYPNSLITKAVKTIDQAIFPDNTLNTDPFDIAIASELVRSENYNTAFTNESSANAVFASFVVATNNETIMPSPDLKKESKTNLKAEKRIKKFEKKKAKLMNRLGKHRLSLAAGLSAGAVLLIILLAILTCAGVCLIIGGVAGLINGELLGLLAILGGAGIGYLSIKGIGKVSKRDKEKQKTELKP